MKRLSSLLLIPCLGMLLAGLIFGYARPTAATTAIPSFSHVFEIVMENEDYNSVIGSSSAPYINSLVQQYGLATRFYATRHPSLPNYLALTGGDTFGITSDCTTCFVNAPNIVDQLEGAGKSWKAYMESMPSPCFVGDSGSLYRQKHNPFIYYNDIRQNSARCNKIVPFTQFATDIQANTLPNYVWITPNMCNDMHDCSVSTGDNWLRTWVSRILSSPAWQQNGVLFITFDESRGSDTSGCCTYAAGGHIPTLVISPLGKRSYQSAIAYDQYSLLRTIEDAWNLPPLGKAACTCSPPMTDFFGSGTPTPTATPTTPPATTPTATPVPGSPTNLVVNGGFELDANGDHGPDSWTSDSRATRSSTSVHSGSYAMRHYATDNSSYTIRQNVPNLVAGATYNFGGWVNIPSTSDSFAFKLQVRWRNASNSVIRTDTIKAYSASTGGWKQATASLVAPAGTTNAQVSMVVSSLNAKIYVDDITFARR